MPVVKESKTVELWEGYTVEVNEQLLDDFDFTSELNAALKEGDLALLVEMYMAVVGGEDVYKDVREHIEKEHDYFSQEALQGILSKIDEAFPKSGNRAQRRSWKNSR